MITGPKGATTVEFEDAEVVLGSDRRCAVVLDDASVSAEHCSIQSVMSAWKVVDLESDAGTRLNGRHVNQAPLRTGDMLELGAFRVVFQDETPTRSAAAPPVIGVRSPSSKGASSAQRGAPGKAARRGAKAKPAARARRETAPRDAEADGRRSARESRHASRQTSNNATTLVLIAGGVLVAAVIGFMMLGDSTPPDQQAFMRMQKAEENFEWRQVVAIAETADLNDPDFGKRMQTILAKAKQQIALEAGHKMTTDSVPAWNAIRAWRQKNWKENDEFIRRIDAFLAEYGANGGAAVDLARQERANVAGDAGGPVPTDAKSAYDKLKLDVQALEKLGRYGDAIQKANEYAKEWGSKAPSLRRDAEALAVTLRKSANNYLAKRIFRAQVKYNEGSPFQARKILNKAADDIGIPELRDRASDALREILSAGE